MKWIGTQTIYDHVRLVKGITLDSVSVTTIQSSGESFVDNDTSLMTSASIADKIEAYGYSTTAGDITGVTAGTGLSGGGTSGAVTLNVDAAQTQITSVGTIGTGVWNGTAVASAYLDADTAHLTTDQTFTGSKTFSNDTTTLTSGNANDPLLLITNTADDATSGRIRFLTNRGADGEDDDSSGMIQFWSYDDGTPSAQQYGRIQTFIDDATSGQESGKMILDVASHDGGVEAGLTLTGGSVNAEVDAIIGAGAASVTTVAGTLTMGSTASMTNAGLLSVANQSNVTGLGTISSGVWEGTAVATDQQKHLMHYQVQGYSAGSTNYVAAKVISDIRAPFLHSVDIGSDGLDAQTIQVWMRTGGHTMTNACTLRKIFLAGNCTTDSLGGQHLKVVLHKP